MIRRIPVVAALLGLLAALPFLAAGTGAFIDLDDLEYVLENPAVRAGLSWPGVRWAFTSFHAGNWHPLTWLSHLLDVSLFGLDPRGHHLVSVLIHALGTALLFLALWRLTGSIARSAFVAALFGVHPLHVESVAWIAQRKDVLAGLCFMLVLLAYERYARRGGALPYLAAVAALATGLSAKPTLITVPFVLLLLDYWPLGRLRMPTVGTVQPGRLRRLVVEKLPFLLLGCASAVVTFLAQRSGEAVAKLEVIPLGVRLANALVAYAVYVGRAVWPARLAPYYPHPLAYPPGWQAMLAAVVVGGISFVAVSGLRRRPALATGWLWFLGMLVPMIGIVQVGSQASADRYLYLPLVGLLVAVAWLPRENAVGRWRSRPALAAAGLVLVAACAGRTYAQAGLWKNAERLFTHTLAVTTGNWVIHDSFGFMLARQGRLDEAIAQYRQSLDVRPGQAETHVDLGAALARSGRIPEAAEQFQLALRLQPASAMAHYNLGLLLSRQGLVPREVVIGHYRESVRLNPGYARAHNGLATELAAAGLREEAIAHFREALRLNPALEEARVNLELALRSGPGPREALRAPLPPR